MNLPICFSSLGCPDFSVEELCQLARDHGISMVEIRALEGTADFALRLADQPAKLQESKALLTQYGVEVRILGSSFCLTTANRSSLDSLVREGRVADVLGAPFLRIFGGGGDSEILTPDLIRSAALLYRDTVQRFQEEGIRARLIVETHGGFTNSKAILEFCAAAGAPVALLWDTHHTWKIGGENLTDTYNQIRSFVRHLHVKDSVSTSGLAHAHRYVLPGQGEFPFAELSRILEETPPDAALSLEWERKWHPELAPIEEALAAWKRVLAS
jgi:sugar phosphate isomerase/epimerase